MESVKLNAGIREAMAISGMANMYFHHEEPWKTIKSEEKDKIDRTELALNICFQLVHLLCGVLAPFIPKICESIEKQANFKKFCLKTEKFEISNKFDCHKINKPEILIQKIQNETIKNLKNKYKGIETISFPLDLVVGKIEEITEHAEDDDLWIIKVNLGNEYSKMTVSDLRKYIKAEEILMKKIIFLNNIKKTKIKGISSHGKIVCVTNNKRTIPLITTKKIGSR
ncbi:hypothetical protein MHBO_002398, partial [Bonamia ostreae]